MGLKITGLTLGALIFGSSCIKQTQFDYSGILAIPPYHYAKITYYYGLWDGGNKECTITTKNGKNWDIMQDISCDGTVDTHMWENGTNRYAKGRIGNEAEFEKILDPEFRRLKDIVNECNKGGNEK